MTTEVSSISHIQNTQSERVMKTSAKVPVYIALKPLQAFWTYAFLFLFKFKKRL